MAQYNLSDHYMKFLHEEFTIHRKPMCIGQEVI